MKYLKNSLFVAGLALSGSIVGAVAPKANLQLTMLTKVNPQGLALWDITNAALDDKGDVAASKLTSANWVKLLEIGKALEEGGRELATSGGIIAAPPGAKLQDEGNGGSSASDVQHYVDAKPELFHSHALELQKTGTKLIEAAKKHDVKQLSDLSNSLDDVCESCHMAFWYPQQR